MVHLALALIAMLRWAAAHQTPVFFQRPEQNQVANHGSASATLGTGRKLTLGDILESLISSHIRGCESEDLDQAQLDLGYVEVVRGDGERKEGRLLIKKTALVVKENWVRLDSVALENNESGLNLGIGDGYCCLFL